MCNHTGQRLLSSLSNPCGAEVFNAELVAGRRVSWEPSLTRNTSVLRSMTTDLAEKTLSSSGLVRLSRHARSVFCLESVVVRALYLSPLLLQFFGPADAVSALASADCRSDWLNAEGIGMRTRCKPALETPACTVS